MRELFSTIAAISTPPAKGGVAIIRISGEEALNIAKRAFSPRGGRTLSRENARVAIFGDILRGGVRIDEGLCTYFPAPASYTGEDMVEISCHGGILITRNVYEAVLEAGAVPAMAGEFTRRAFIGGKLSLTEAEAIGMLLEAKSEGQLKLSRGDARRSLSKKLDGIKGELISLLSSTYARIDYPDEDLGDFTDSELISGLERIYGELQRLSDTYKTGRAVAEGVETVICGLPNAGKSTLYNLLSGGDFAIVTDTPGTTRDVLEREVSLGDVLLRLQDTAGIREGELDKVEKIGIERSLERVDSAELILALFDAACGINAPELSLIERIERSDSKKIALLTKCDKADEKDILIAEMALYSHFDKVLRISVKERSEEAIELLNGAVSEYFTDGSLSIGNDAIISSARQNAALSSAISQVCSALDALRLGLPQDIASSDIELALGTLSELDGKAVSEAVVADIFAKFCVGK